MAGCRIQSGTHCQNFIEAGVNGEPVIDLNRDKEAPEDEPEVAIPQKQKFSNYRN